MSASLFRVVLGGYLAVHFAALVPWAAELFSSEGLLPDGSASPLLLPLNIFRWCDSPVFVTGSTALAAVLGVAIALGRRDRMAAALLCYLHACFLGRNPLILNPAVPYVGWLLLAHALTPRTGTTAEGAQRSVREAGFWLLALGYTYSGAAKLSSPSWLDGSAVARILENPLARDTSLREILLGLPEPLLAILTSGVLMLECLFAPLALAPRLRPWLWGAMLGVHLALLSVLAFADLTLGMVLIHLFTFDPGWLRATQRRPS